MLCSYDCGAAAAERDCRNGRCVRGFRNSSEGAREQAISGDRERVQGEYNTLRSCVDEAGKVAHGRGNALTSGSCRSCSRSTIDATRN